MSSKADNDKVYDEKYYQRLFVRPIWAKLGLSKIYYLWISYFCIKKAAGLKKRSSVLDFGCGVGNLVWALRKIGIDAQGIDPSEPAKKYCRVPRYCRYEDTRKIQFEDRSFDLVYTHEVLEHLLYRDLAASLDELSRVSRGKMIHMVCVKDRGKIVSLEPTHKIIQTESWWKKTFEELGFRVKTGNFFYFFPFIPYLFAGTLNFRAIKKGFFILYKRR